MKTTLGVIAGLLLAAAGCENRNQNEPLVNRRVIEQPAARDTTVPAATTEPASGPAAQAPAALPAGTQDTGPTAQAPAVAPAPDNPVTAYPEDTTYDYAHRDTLAAKLRDRADAVEMRIKQLEARTDDGARRTAREARERRAELSHDIDKISHQSEHEWNKFRSKVSRGVDRLEHDVNDALR